MKKAHLYKKHKETNGLSCNSKGTQTVPLTNSTLICTITPKEYLRIL